LLEGLKPLSEREASAEEVTNRLRPKLDQIAGASLYLGADQDVQVAGPGYAHRTFFPPPSAETSYARMVASSLQQVWPGWRGD
jgi:hypothetical protein